MRALVQVIVKEFLQLRQDRKMIPVLVGAPIMQLVALGFAANLDVNLIPMVLVDQDRSPESRRLVERFSGSGYFEVVGACDTVSTVEPWLVTGRAQVALVIGAGYGEALARGSVPRLQMIADGSDANSAVLGLGYASRIVAGLGGELLQRRLMDQVRASRAAAPSAAQGAALALGSIEMTPRVWYNPDLKSRWFYVPAVLAMVLLLVTMMLPSMAIVREKEIGTLEQISVTPLRSWQLVVGKTVPFVLIGLFDMLVIVALARWVFGVPLQGSLALLTLLTLLYFLNTLGLGLLVSTAVATQQQAMMFSAFVFMIPMLYLSGLLFPIENMPAAIQYVTYAIPVRYYAIILRSVFLKGSGIGVLWPEALTLLLMGLALLALASLRFRKRLD